MSLSFHKAFRELREKQMLVKHDGNFMLCDMFVTRVYDVYSLSATFAHRDEPNSHPKYDEENFNVRLEDALGGFAAMSAIAIGSRLGNPQTPELDDVYNDAVKLLMSIDNISTLIEMVSAYRKRVGEQRGSKCK